MVAKISTPQRVSAALNYNEQKVQKSKAVCLAAIGYLRNVQDLNFYQKLEGLEGRNALNTRATTKSIHVSLNFDPSETFSKEKFIAIATRYMEGIGFGNQPYLVYQHTDAGHPHLHIVSSAIREDGTRINLHNLGKGLSERTRKTIEKEFGLVHAGKRPSKREDIPPVKPVAYGEAETKRAIENAVHFIRQHYCFHSLAQFNACLRLLGVQANAGKEGGRIQRHGGLMYEILDARGKPIGVPLKASRLSGKPTLKNLEREFARHQEHKERFLFSTRSTIQKALLQPLQSLEHFSGILKDAQIDAVFYRSIEGKLYGITYVDHQQKVVFSGSELGKQFSAAAVLNAVESEGHSANNRGGKDADQMAAAQTPPRGPSMAKEIAMTPPVIIANPLQALLQVEIIPELQGAAGVSKKRKRKKQRPNNL